MKSEVLVEGDKRLVVDFPENPFEFNSVMISLATVPLLLQTAQQPPIHKAVL